jgi:hypothetical protein
MIKEVLQIINNFMVRIPKRAGVSQMREKIMSAETEAQVRMYVKGFVDCATTIIDNNRAYLDAASAVYQASVVQYCKHEDSKVIKPFLDWVLSEINNLFQQVRDLIENHDELDDAFIEVFDEDTKHYCVALSPDAMNVMMDEFEYMFSTFDNFVSKVSGGTITKLPNTIKVENN